MSETKDRLLDAATEVLLQHGAQNLTLAAVAERAGVSKGGLLYHFPSKPALAAGMVDRFVEQCDKALLEAGNEPGAASRGYLRSSIAPEADVTGAAGDHVTAALFAAALVEPETLRPLRDRYTAWQERLADDGLDPATATVVRLAVDGWWLARIADLAPPAGRLHEQVYTRLVELTEA